MRSFALLLPIALAAGLSVPSAAQEKVPEPDHSRSLSASLAPSLFRAPARTLPSLPPGVLALSFSDFFVQPIGERGLTMTARLKAMDGSRVRIPGYMVRQEQPVKGQLLLSPIPIQLHEKEYGLADDLPPSAVWVTVPARRDRIVPYQSGILLLTGVLHVGNRDEPDGRVSLVRLALDPPPASPALAGEAASVTEEEAPR